MTGTYTVGFGNNGAFTETGDVFGKAVATFTLNGQLTNADGSSNSFHVVAHALFDEEGSPDALAPRLVIVLAGPFIWPFTEPLALGDLERADPPFTLVGRARASVPWVCGMHPGGAQRRGWPARQYAELIIAEAAKLGVHASQTSGPSR